MLIVQKFHSIHEIDQEFIPSLELLLQEEIPGFSTLIEKHDKAPDSEVFTYFLFFGPTQNTPIGFAQLCLHQLPGKDLVSWWKRIFKFWDKEYLHWKQMTWKVGDGNSGVFVFDSRFARTGREKIQELMKEYEARPEMKTQEIYFLKGLQDFQSSWNSSVQWSKELYVLEPLIKAHKTYQNYLESLKPDIAKHIKNSWKELHKKLNVSLGEYSSVKDIAHNTPVEKSVLEQWEKRGAQIITFEKDTVVLGCLMILKGKNGNIFFEPFPFEPQAESLVSDELYIQYALLKFYEISDARKCHLMKFGTKLVFDDKEDLSFFQEQGFQSKTITHSFSSKLSKVTAPL